MKTKLLILIASAGLAITAHAQYGAVESFYQANPDLPTGQYAGQPVNPGYLLINWNRWQDLDARMLDNGYVRLGTSNWTDLNYAGGGIPQRDLALSYARVIGATHVIYATGLSNGNGQDRTEHLVMFYAHAGLLRAVAVSNNVLSNTQALAAMNRLQDFSQPSMLEELSAICGS